MFTYKVKVREGHESFLWGAHQSKPNISSDLFLSLHVSEDGEPIKYSGHPVTTSSPHGELYAGSCCTINLKGLETVMAKIDQGDTYVTCILHTE